MSDEVELPAWERWLREEATRCDVWQYVLASEALAEIARLRATIAAAQERIPQRIELPSTLSRRVELLVAELADANCRAARAACERRDDAR